MLRLALRMRLALRVRFALTALLLSTLGCSSSQVEVAGGGALADSAHVPLYSPAELLGHYDPSEHPEFSRIPSDWTDKEEIYLRSEVLDAFGRMRAAADSAGVALLIRSATRNFTYQRGIWERKWERPRYMGWSAFEKARDIMTYSSMPGTSRHHWGTDLDLCAFENEWFETGEGLLVYAWLVEHAARFGFHQVYSDRAERTGYHLERWHWSYMPLAQLMLADYNVLLSSDSLGGFSGASVADSLDVIQLYVNGID
jgi:D-alanyl-D-alanine carboxypeptidase